MNMLKKIYYIFNKRQRIHTVILFIIMFIGGFFEFLGVSAILPLVNVIVDPQIITNNEIYAFVYDIFQMDSSRDFVILVSLVLIIIYIFKNLFILEMNNLQFRFTCNNQRRLAYRLMSCYMKQDYLFHVSRNSADLQRNIVQDVNNFFATVLYVLQLSAEIIVCIMLVICLFVVDIWTTLGAFAIIGGFTGVFYIIYKKRLVEGGNRKRMLEGQVIKWIQQSLGGIKEIKVMNAEAGFLKMFDSTYNKSMVTKCKQQMIIAIPKPLLESFCICGLLLVIVGRIMAGADMEQFVSTLSVFALASFRLLPSFNRITTHLGNIMFSKASVDAIYEELQLVQNKENEKIENNLIGMNCLTFEREIDLHNISFAYPNSEKKVINNLSLTIPKNKSVAFIGSSGSGKTTLVDLILGVLKPAEGTIFSDGMDIRNDYEAWHEKLGYIPQNIYLIDDTIKNNIAFGVPENDIEEEKIWASLREAQLEEYVRNLPDGIDTMIGEMGVRLSGGQRQRIGIARTLFRNREILVMDEATSALDNETEQGVMEAINNLSGTKTMIIVAHRLTTIINCDIIYEVSNDSIREVNREEVLERINKK